MIGKIDSFDAFSIDHQLSHFKYYIWSCYVTVATEQTPELVLRHNFLGTFGLAANQASKLGIGTNKSIICMYENHQVG